MGGTERVIVAKYKTRNHWFKKIHPAHQQLLAMLRQDGFHTYPFHT